MKDTWKEYFAFNKRQRSGILVLVTLITLLVAYLFIADYFPPTSKPIDFSSFKSDLEKAGVKQSNVNRKSSNNKGYIEINSADTGVLMTLPKMTSYCAAMITRYRKKLGGYYSVKQLMEVWGMDSVIYKGLSDKVCIDTGLVHKININTADSKELGYHPYVKYYLAKAIVNYREQHGLFSSLSALHKMVAIDDSTYSRIVPYLTVK